MRLFVRFLGNLAKFAFIFAAGMHFFAGWFAYPTLMFHFYPDHYGWGVVIWLAPMLIGMAWTYTVEGTL